MPGMVQKAASAAKPSPCSIAKKTSDTTASCGTDATSPPTRGPRRSTTAVPPSVKPADTAIFAIRSRGPDDPGESTKRDVWPGLEPPDLIPRRVRADAFAGHRHLDHVRAVLPRDGVHAAPERWTQILHRGHALAIHALGAGQPDVVGGGGAQEEPGVLALADHLAVRHLARPVVAHDLVALVVRDDGEHGRVVAGHGPEAGGAVGEGAVSQVQHDGPLAADGDLRADGSADAESEGAAPAPRPRHAAVPEGEQRGAGRRAFLHHHGVTGQNTGQVRFEHGRMHHRIVLVLAYEVFLALDERLRVRADLGALARPARHLLRRMQACDRLAQGAQRVAQLALRGQVERVVPAHEKRVRADLHDSGLGHRAVHALATHEEEQVGLEPGDLLEVLRHGIHAAVEGMARREVDEDLAAREDGRLEELGEPHRLRLRPTAPHVVAEHEHRALRLAETLRDGLYRLRPRGARALDLIARALADLRLEPFAVEERSEEHTSELQSLRHLVCRL